MAYIGWGGYGVYANSDASQGGAGIYGTNSNNTASGMIGTSGGFGGYFTTSVAHMAASYHQNIPGGISTWLSYSGYGVYTSANIWANGTLYTSDIRYKENINTIDSPMAKINKLHGVYYNWRVDEFKDKTFSQERQIGFIAQEVEEVLPEVVNVGPDRYKAVDYAKITAVLVEALKEQQVKISELEDKIKKLEEGRR